MASIIINPSQIVVPTINVVSSKITDFGDCSYVQNGILHIDCYFHTSGNFVDQEVLLSISGYTAKRRADGLLITKMDNVVSPVYINVGSNMISINSTLTASSYWTFCTMDILVDAV